MTTNGAPPNSSSDDDDDKRKRNRSPPGSPEILVLSEQEAHNITKPTNTNDSHQSENEHENEATDDADNEDDSVLLPNAQMEMVDSSNSAPEEHRLPVHKRKHTIIDLRSTNKTLKSMKIKASVVARSITNTNYPPTPIFIIDELTIARDICSKMCELLHKNIDVTCSSLYGKVPENYRFKTNEKILKKLSEQVLFYDVKQGNITDNFWSYPSVYVTTDKVCIFLTFILYAYFLFFFCLFAD